MLLSVSKLAEMVGCSTRTVRRRCLSLPITRGAGSALMLESTLALPLIFGSAATAGDRLDLGQERAHLARSQRTKLDLEVSALKESLLRTEDVQAHFQRIVMVVRARFLAIPSRLAAVCPGMSQQDVFGFATELIHAALNELGASNWETDDGT